MLILGESGSGKSTSLRNFEPGEIGIFNVASKPLPFRKKLPTANGAVYETILRSLSAKKLRAYAIDDSQYLLAFEFFDRAAGLHRLFSPPHRICTRWDGQSQDHWENAG